MLSSARALQFEPRFPPSSSRSQSYRSARSGSSNYMDATPASTSRLSTPPKLLPLIPPSISPSSIFYQVLTAPYQAHPVVSPSNHMDPHAEPSVDWTGENPSSETRGDKTVGSNATGSTSQKRQIFTPHGRWAWADGLTVDDTEELMQLECRSSVEFCEPCVYGPALPAGTMRSAAIKTGTLGSRRITYISQWYVVPTFNLSNFTEFRVPLAGKYHKWTGGTDSAQRYVEIVCLRYFRKSDPPPLACTVQGRKLPKTSTR